MNLLLNAEPMESIEHKESHVAKPGDISNKTYSGIEKRMKFRNISQGKLNKDSVTVFHGADNGVSSSSDGMKGEEAADGTELTEMVKHG